MLIVQTLYSLHKHQTSPLIPLGTGGYGEADEFEAVCGFLEYVEGVWLGFDNSALLRDGTRDIEDISCDGLISVVLGQIEAETLVYLGNLAASGELVDARRCLAHGKT